MRTKRIVGFSGGADSQAVAIWVRQRFPPEEIVLLNSNAGGNEHPVTDQFIKDYSRDHFPITVVPALIRDLGGVGTQEGKGPKKRRDEYSEDDEMTFADMAYIKGRFPSRSAQFCTELLKLAPSKRWIKENLIDPDPTVTIERYIGVRRDESTKRSCVPEEEWDDYFDCPLFRPIATWTKAQVFDFIYANGEEPNPLYKMGFSRVGCAPCINANKEDIRNWALRFPEMIDKIRDWEAQVGRTFFPSGIMPNTPLPWIDDVVAWSKTQRGGKIPLPEVPLEACSSKYGLCE